MRYNAGWPQARSMIAVLAAGLITAGLASIIQTQVVLSELIDLGAPITMLVRIRTTLADLMTLRRS